MKYFRTLLLTGLLLSLFAGMTHAFEDPYAVAEERINRALETRSTVLHLDNLDLTEVPPTIGQLTWLRQLDMSNNQLTELPKQLDQLRELRRFDVSFNALTEFPVQVTGLPLLEWVNVGYNTIQALPPEIGHMKRLTRLYVNNNHLSYLPPQIGQLDAMQRLYISNNYLRDLPQAIYDLDMLRMLVVDDNQLDEVPVFLRDMPYLRVSVIGLRRGEAGEIPPTVTLSRNGISDSTRYDAQQPAGTVDIAEVAFTTMRDLALAAGALGLATGSLLLGVWLWFKPKRKRKAF